MMACPKCGRELPEGALVCDKCGAKQGQEHDEKELKTEAFSDTQSESASPADANEAVDGTAVEEMTAWDTASETNAERTPESQDGTLEGVAKAQEMAEDSALEAPAEMQDSTLEAPADGQERAAEVTALVKLEAEKLKTGEETTREDTTREETTQEETTKEETTQEETTKEETTKEETTKEKNKKDKTAGKETANFVPVEKLRALFSNAVFRYSCIGVAALLVLVLLGCIISMGKGKKDYVVYLKERELSVSDLSPKGRNQISTRLANDGDMDNYALMNDTDLYECKISEDGKWVFYPDKMERSDDGITLYARKLQKLKKDPVKIDSSIEYYAVNDKSTLVTYRKSTGELYQYNLKKEDKSKIDVDVKEYRVSEDGAKVYYRKRTGELYVWTRAKQTKEKLDSDITSIAYLTKDAKTIYLIKDGSLYKKVESKDREKIASEVKRIFKIYDSGEIYYSRNDADFKALWFYDGKESTRITDKLDNCHAYAKNAPVIIYQTTADEPNAGYFHVAVKKTVADLDHRGIDSILVSEDGKTFYYMTDVNSSNSTGDVYKVTLSGGKANIKTELYDSDVSERSLRLTKEGHYVYFKDVMGDKGDLYCDKKKVDIDVETIMVSVDDKNKKIVYLADYDQNKDRGTLKIAGMNGVKGRKIAEDVYLRHFSVTTEGNVVYLFDYDKKYYKGTLMVYQGNKSQKLDEDVSMLVYVN